MLERGGVNAALFVIWGRAPYNENSGDDLVGKTVDDRCKVCLKANTRDGLRSSTSTHTL